MQELTFNVDITVKCQKCNSELSTEFNERRMILEVEPCDSCLSEAHDAGKEEAAEELLEQQEAAEAAEET